MATIGEKKKTIIFFLKQNRTIYLDFERDIPYFRTFFLDYLRGVFLQCNSQFIQFKSNELLV